MFLVPVTIFSIAFGGTVVFPVPKISKAKIRAFFKDNFSCPQLCQILFWLNKKAFGKLFEIIHL